MIILVVTFDHFKQPKLVKQIKIKQIIDSQGLDNVSEYSLTTELAQEADLPNALDAMVKTELAIDDLELSSAINEDVAVKAVPIFDLADVGRKIRYHVVGEGETIKQVSEKYNITLNTIKWANNLKTNELKPGQKLKILPLDGIVYKVKQGDTLDKIAKKYKANQDRIVVFNDLEVSGVKKDQEIVIPEGILPEIERPDYVPPIRTRTVARAITYYRPASSSGGFYNVHGNPFPNRGIGANRAYYGQCTWWVTENYLRRGDNRLRGRVTGHARQWRYSLPTMGFTYSSLPVVGAIYQTSYGGGGYGHVGIVTAVKKDGAGNITGYTISEMNAAGWNVVDNRDMKLGGGVSFFY